MKFTFLGTSAAEGFPAMFCTCDTCRRAAIAGGRNLRGRSQALVNEDLLIDFPADTCMRVLTGKLDLPSVRHCLITHSHSDHLYAQDLSMRRDGYAVVPDSVPFTIYASEYAGASIRKVIAENELEQKGYVRYRQIRPFEPFQVLHYTVTPLKADHCPGTVLYLIADGDKKLLYAHDTGYFPEETWWYLEQTKPQLSFVSLDCTFGPRQERINHMGLDADREVANRLRKTGCVDGSTIIYVNHFTHFCGATYDEIVPMAEKYGFGVSYDNCSICF